MEEKKKIIIIMMMLSKKFKLHYSIYPDYCCHTAKLSHKLLALPLFDSVLLKYHHD
jgi:hypothetical protein